MLSVSVIKGTSHFPVLPKVKESVAIVVDIFVATSFDVTTKLRKVLKSHRLIAAD